MSRYDPLMPCFTEPDPGPSLLDQHATAEAQSRERAAEIHRRRRVAVSEADRIVASMRAEVKP